MMIRNANSGQLLELASALTRNMPRHIGEETAKAWIENPATLRKVLHEMLLNGELARTTGLVFDGPSSYVTAGQGNKILPKDGWTIQAIVQDDGQAIRFSVSKSSGRGEYWDLALAAPKEDKIAVGAFSNATRYPFQEGDRPGLCFSGCHRGNNALTGNFEVLEVKIEGGELTAFAADFTQFDEGRADWVVTGSIRYNSTLPFATK